MLAALGVRSYDKHMHRLTARLLLLFALAGSLAPVALAMTAAPPHACCLRKSAHHCHGSASANPSESSISGANCCKQNCSRAVTSLRWAHAPSRVDVLYPLGVGARLFRQESQNFNSNFLGLHSTRGPPSVLTLIYL